MLYTSCYLHALLVATLQEMTLVLLFYLRKKNLFQGVKKTFNE